MFFQINGLSGLLEKNVRSQISSIVQNNQILPNRRLFARIDNVIHKDLKIFGYYDPIIDFNLCSSSQSRKSHQVLIIRINTGPPVRIANTNIVLHGEAKVDQDYLNLLDKHPSIGTVLNHNDYINFKKAITSIALRKGYFDGKFNQSHLNVVLAKHRAFWNIDYDSGQRYRFGTIIFEGSQIYDRYLQNIIPFKKGDYFDSAKLSELIHRLSKTGWFNSVVIIPILNKSSQEKFLDLHGVVSPHDSNAIRIGIGHSTNIGPHIKGSWNKPWINSYGHSLTANTSVSALEKQFVFRYKIPVLRNPLDQYFLIQGGIEFTNLKGAAVNSSILTVSRHWDRSNGWHRAIKLCLIRDHFMNTDIDNASMVFDLGPMFDQNFSHDDLIPTWEISKHYSLDYSNKILNSRTNYFLIAQMKNTWIQTLHDWHRFIIHGNFGWIKVANFNQVPLDFHFFSNDYRSIHNSKYKSIPLKRENGKLIGDSRLITGSIEYQYNLAKRWWGAVFVDGGETMSNIQCNDFKIGIGIGMKWESPIGSMKFNCAIPISDKEENNLQFYIDLEPEL